MEDEEEKRIGWQRIMVADFYESLGEVKNDLDGGRLNSTDAHNAILAKLSDLRNGLVWVQEGCQDDSPPSSEGQSSAVDASEASHSRRSSSGYGSAVAMTVTPGLSSDNSCHEQSESDITDFTQVTQAVEKAIRIKKFLAEFNLEEIMKTISAAPTEVPAQISNSVEGHDSISNHVLSEEAIYPNGTDPMAEDSMLIDMRGEVQYANVIPQISTLIADGAPSVCPQDIDQERWIADTSAGNGINDAAPSFFNSNLDTASTIVPDTAVVPEFQGTGSDDEVDDTPEEPPDVKCLLNFGQSSGRKNIRPINENLRPETAAAVQREEERGVRKQERDLELEGFQYLKAGNPANSNNAVLDYDLVTQKPALLIDATLVPLLTKYQMEGVQFMWSNCYESLVEQAKPGSEGGGCILAHHMGLGKTFQVVSFLHTVLTSPKVRAHTALVLSPLIVVENWAMEFDKWLGKCSQKVHVYGFSKRTCLKDRLEILQKWQRTGGVLILSYAIFRATLKCTQQDLSDQISFHLLDPGPDIVVCDEGHILKTCVTQGSGLLHHIRTKRRIILTGTPLQNKPMEYYIMVNFVKPNLLGTETEFRNSFDNPIKNGLNRDSTEEDVLLMKARSHVLRRQLKNCVHRLGYEFLLPLLPPKHEYVIVVLPTAVQRKLTNAYLAMIGDPSARISAKKFLGDIQQLSKILSHPINLTYETNSRKKNSVSGTHLWWKRCIESIEDLGVLENSNKLVLLLDILECCAREGDKTVVFSHYKYTLNIIEDALDKMLNWRKGIEYFRLDGDTNTDCEDRQKMINEFNSQSCGAKAFLISTSTGGTGINLPSANRVVLFEASTNPAVDMQAVFRAYRLGQPKPCYVYRLIVGGTMEEIVYRSQLKKQSMADRIIDDKNPERHSREIDYRNIYMPIPDESQSAQSVLETSDNVLLTLMKKCEEIIQTCLDHKGLVENQEESGLTAEQRKEAWREYELNRFNTANRVHHLMTRRSGRKEVNSAVPGPSTSAGGNAGTSDETLTELGERQRRRMSSAECGRHNNAGNSNCVFSEAPPSPPEVITIESSDDEIQLLESSDEESTEEWGASAPQANSNTQSFNPVIVSTSTLRENANSNLDNNGRGVDSNGRGVIRSTSRQGSPTQNQTGAIQQLGTPGKSRIVVNLGKSSGSSNVKPSSSKSGSTSEFNSSSIQSKGNDVGASNLVVTLNNIPDSPASPDVPQVPVVRTVLVNHDAGPGTNSRNVEHEANALTKKSTAAAGASNTLSRASCESQTELKRRRLSNARGEPLDRERARERVREVYNRLTSSSNVASHVHEAHAGTSRQAEDYRNVQTRGRSNERKRNDKSRWATQQTYGDPYEFREDSRDALPHLSGHNLQVGLPSEERHSRQVFDGENYYRHEEPSTSRPPMNGDITRSSGRGRYQRNARHRGHYRGRGRGRGQVDHPDPPNIRPMHHRESSSRESDYVRDRRNRSSSSRRSISPQRDRPEPRQYVRSYRSRSRSHERSTSRYRRQSGGSSPSSRSRRDMPPGRSPVRYPSPPRSPSADLSRIAPPRIPMNNYPIAQLVEPYSVENNTDDVVYSNDTRNYNHVQNDHQHHYGDQSSSRFY